MHEQMQKMMAGLLLANLPVREEYKQEYSSSCTASTPNAGFGHEGDFAIVIAEAYPHQTFMGD